MTNGRYLPIAAETRRRLGAVAAWSWLFALVVFLAPVWIATLAYLALRPERTAA